MYDLVAIFLIGYIAVFMGCLMNGLLFNKPHFFHPKKRIYPWVYYYLLPVILTLVILALNDIFGNIERNLEFKFIFTELLILTLSLLKFKDSIYEFFVIGGNQK